MLKMRPHLRPIMPGRTARIIRNAPVRLVSRILSQRSSGAGGAGNEVFGGGSCGVDQDAERSAGGFSRSDKGIKRALVPSIQMPGMDFGAAAGQSFSNAFDFWPFQVGRRVVQSCGSADVGPNRDVRPSLGQRTGNCQSLTGETASDERGTAGEKAIWHVEDPINSSERRLQPIPIEPFEVRLEVVHDRIARRAGFHLEQRDAARADELAQFHPVRVTNVIVWIDFPKRFLILADIYAGSKLPVLPVIAELVPTFALRHPRAPSGQ